MGARSELSDEGAGPFLLTSRDEKRESFSLSRRMAAVVVMNMQTISNPLLLLFKKTGISKKYIL